MIAKHNECKSEIVWSVANTNLGVQFEGYAWCSGCKKYVSKKEVLRMVE